MATSARIVGDFGYDEINLNVGCPSDRVKEGRFGACLMAEPERVAACVAAMKQAVVRDGRVIDADSHDANVRGVRQFAEMIASEPRLCATAIQTVGSKGYDGFVLAVVI